MFRKAIIIAIIAVTAGSFAAFASESKSGTSTSSKAEKKISLDDAEKIALNKYPGTVVESEAEKGLYEVKIETDGGKTVKLKIDPADGSIVSFAKKRSDHERREHKGHEEGGR